MNYKHTYYYIKDALEHTKPITDLIKKHHEYTYKHSIQVASLAVQYGKSQNYSEERLYELAAIGLLHDLGKINIPIEILDKPDKLSDREFDIIKEHVNYDLVNKLIINENIKRGILEHHEDYDGGGYPKKLKGKEISENGRIIHIIDTFDALLDQRAYKLAMNYDNVIEIFEKSEKRYDINIYKKFKENIDEKNHDTAKKISNLIINLEKIKVKEQIKYYNKNKNQQERD